MTAELTVRFKGLEPGQRLEIGLLLADLLRQSGSDQTAMKLYGQLTIEKKTDAKPLLTLALLRQEQRNSEAVQTLLKQAQERRDANGRIHPLNRCCGSTARIERSPQHRIRTLQPYGFAGGF